jgi:parvulin-like peptidyl-prolyl isomerase
MMRGLFIQWCVSGSVILRGATLLGALQAKAPETPGAISTPTTAPTTSPAGVPASQPAREIVLVRVGDTEKGIISQEEFNSYFYGGPIAPFEATKERFMRELVERKWFQLYLDDHPELNVEAAVREQAELLMKRQNLKTDEEFTAWLLTKRMTPEIWRRQARIQLAKTKLGEMGGKRGADEENLKKIFEAAPNEFNGTRLAARHILIGSPPYDTPAEKKAKREKAERIRQELLSGKRTWEDAVKESTDDTKAINGNIGSFWRHDGIMEDLAAVLFPMEMHKLSEVVETPLGFHILELIRYDVNTRSFEQSKADIKTWLQREPYIQAIREAKMKYPAVGVQAPMTPTRPPWMPEVPVLRTQSRPAMPPIATRPSTRPVRPPPKIAPIPPRTGTQPAPLHPMTRPAPGVLRPGPGPGPKWPATRPAAPRAPGT